MYHFEKTEKGCILFFCSLNKSLGRSEHHKSRVLLNQIPQILLPFTTKSHFIVKGDSEILHQDQDVFFAGGIQKQLNSAALLQFHRMIVQLFQILFQPGLFRIPAHNSQEHPDYEIEKRCDTMLIFE